MVERGLIERAQGPGRIIHHRLTKEGERVRRAGAKRLERVLEQPFAALSSRELAELDRLPAKLTGESPSDTAVR